MNTTTRRRRRIGALAVSGVAVLALGLGACGGGDDTAAGTSTSASPATELSAFEVVQASSQQSQEEGSARFSLTTTGTGEAAAASVTADGAFDAATGAFEATVALPAEAGGSKLTVRVADEVAYLSGAPLTAEGRWARVPLEQLGATGLDTSAVDPSRQLEQLRGVAEDVREVEPQTIRGVQAEGYAGTIDAVEALSLAPAEQQTEEARAAAAELGTIPFTLFVDEENRPVRMTQEFTVEGSTVEVSMDFYDWGSDVDVTAPDPATVGELPGLGAAVSPDAAAQEPATAGA